MRKFALLALGIGFINALSADPVCHKCELIREANKHKVNKYTYYEDYQKDNPNAPPIEHQENTEDRQQDQ